MKPSDGILAGIITCTVYLFTLSAFVEKKINSYNIIIDTTNKELIVKCDSKGISAEQFFVYTRLENKDIFLYTKGSEVSESSKNIVTVDHKYKLKHINYEDLSNMKYTIEDDKLIVTIPLSSIDKRLSVKKIK